MNLFTYILIELLEKILNTLRNDGNIMICTDTGGRVLELAYFLDQLWKNENSGLFSYSIVLLSNVSVSVIEFAKSQVEWMNDKIVQSFEIGRYNPFEFKHIKLCRTIDELNNLNRPSNNKLVLVSQSDLECGFGRELFASWCENPKNTIIFTSRSIPIPSPPAGGIPTLSARTKSWSIFAMESSSDCPAS